MCEDRNGLVTLNFRTFGGDDVHMSHVAWYIFLMGSTYFYGVQGNEAAPDEELFRRNASV